MKLLIFDTETNAKPRDFNAPATQVEQWPRMVSLAYRLIDTQDNHRVIATCHSFVKPNGWQITPDAFNVHGITTEEAGKRGKPILGVIHQFGFALGGAEAVCGHNIQFDVRVVCAEYIRLGFQMEYEKLHQLRRLDTMWLGLNICKIPGKRGGYKWPKLGELYQRLFGEPLEDAHDAMADVIATEKCLFAINKIRPLSDSSFKTESF